MPPLLILIPEAGRSGWRVAPCQARRARLNTYPVGLGVGSTDQLVPFHRSASVRNVERSLL